MRHARFFGLPILLLLLAAACQKFDNPVENGAAGRSSGLVKVTVDGIDPHATVLGVDLHWSESGAVHEVVFHKLVPLDGASKKLLVSFDGLGGGLGYAEAGSYIGQVTWQPPVRGETLLISPTGIGLSKIALGFLDGDADLDFDLDFDTAGEQAVESDGDAEADGADGDPSERDAETEDLGPWEPKALLDIPYSSRTPLLDGQVDSGTEWQDAATAQIPTGVPESSRLYAKHNAQALYLALVLPGQATPSGEAEKDRLVLGFDVGQTAGDDAYLLEFKRGGTSPTCTLVNADGARGCANLSPHPDYNWRMGALTNGEGFSLEIVIPFSALGIASGDYKTVRFAAFYFDNSETGAYTWPAMSAQSQTVYGWGGLHSLGRWASPTP